jgi:hypothetical protein
MAEIPISPNEHFVLNNSKTTITTNLSAPEIEKRYGNGLRSRMKNRLYLFIFNPNFKDRR